jgi:hypothetical protein
MQKVNKNNYQKRHIEQTKSDEITYFENPAERLGRFR